MMAIPYNQAMVFARTDGWNFGSITVTPRILKVLSLVDGKTSLEEMQDVLSLSEEELIVEIKNLQNLGLVTLSTEVLQTIPGSSLPQDDKNYWNSLREIVADL